MELRDEDGDEDEMRDEATGDDGTKNDGAKNDRTKDHRTKDEDRTELLARLRPQSFAIAYRMLGTITDAEDIAQEALLRLHRELESGRQIDSPPAFLTTVTTRLAIDQLRSARVRREQYPGEWLPEPLIRNENDDPAHRAEIADSLSLAFLVLLETLSPEQRAALLLRDVFGYGYDEIGPIVGKSSQNVRQLVSRARRHVEARRPRFRSTREQRDELAHRFFAAAQDGDIATLETLLAHDVALHGDGGGKAPALARSVHGRSRVVKTLITWFRHSRRITGFSIEVAEVNGQPGAITRDGTGRVFSVLALTTGTAGITAIHSVINPDKLHHVASRPQ
jgi:RNA polymerase sigma-70 factor (TIGR02957 family)